jgi:hypothetical protein
MLPGYCPEVYSIVCEELHYKQQNNDQGMISKLEQQFDFLMPVSVHSTSVVMAPEGHLDHVSHVFAY